MTSTNLPLLCGASMQVTRTVCEADETRSVQAGGKRYQGGGRQKEKIEDGIKVEGESGWVSVYCWSALLSAGVTLAPPSRGQYWRLTGLVWHVWVEVEVELKARGASSSELRPVTHSQSHVCGGQIGRLADRRLTGTCIRTDRQKAKQCVMETVWTEIRPVCHTALGWCIWLALLMDWTRDKETWLLK